MTQGSQTPSDFDDRGDGYNHLASSSSSLPWSSANVTSSDSTDRLTLYVVTVILVILSVVGTGGNALVIYVFSKKKDKLVSTLFILVLALVDFVTCLVVIPYTLYMEYVNFHISSDVSCKLYQFLITSNIPFSAFIMVAIAVDRYFCICHPFLHAVTIFRAKIIVAVLGFLAGAIGVCVSLIYSVYNHQHLNHTTNDADYELEDFNITTFSLDGMYARDPEVDTAIYPEIISGSQSERPRVSGSGDDDGGGGLSVVFVGKCDPTELVVGELFRSTFHKIYVSLYAVCLVVVIALYILIYRSVLARRTKRQSEKSKSLSLVVSSSAAVCKRQFLAEHEDSLFTTDGHDPHDCLAKNGGGGHQQQRGRRKDGCGGLMGRKSISLAAKWDMNRMANLKTAAMLFVVTVVFVVTFFPAFLMSLSLVPYNMIVFYMYFANNVANPVIYSFMNKNFRDDTKRLLCR